MQPTDYQNNSGSSAGGVGAGYEDGLTVAELRQQYLDWSNAKTAEIDEARQARHYYHGDQWTADELRILKKRRQPAITFNRVNRKVDGVVGTLKKLWQDPKAFPRSPNHDEDAETATQAIKYALDQARWKAKGIDGTRKGAMEGAGIVALILERGDRGDPEIGLELIDGETWFYDARSFKPDYSDARFMGEAKWLDLDVAKEMYPDKAEELDGLISSGGDVQNNAQTDREKNWINVKAKRLFVIEQWYLKNGGWHVCHYTGNTKLAGAPSPYTDEKGKSQSKYIAYSAYVDHDGDRYGFVRNLKSPQDEVNMRRSKGLHNLNTRRIVMEMGAIDETVGIERVREEAARPDGVVVVNRGGARFEFDDQQKAAEWQGQMEMLQEAKAEIENFGPTLVEKGMEKSGRAIALLQQAGLAELGPFIDAWSDWKLRIYRAVWNAIRKHWTAERWIRVTDDEGAARFVQLNGLAINDMGQPIMVNQVAALDVDIILDEAPDTINTMQDVFELLESLAAAGVPVPPEVVIEMSSLPASVKRKVLAMLQQARQPDPMQEKAKEIALAGEEAKVNKTVAETEKTRATTAETVAGIEMDNARLEDDRLNADRDFAGRNADRSSRERQQQQRTMQ